MTMVATDGRRLALVDEEVDVSERSSGEFIMPAKAVNELSRLLQEKGEVEIKYTDNQAAFTLKDDSAFSVLVVSKLIEGNYPNYRQVIPAETKERISLAREEFLHALRRAEIMTSEKSNSVKLTFSKNNLAITANSPEVGEARESLAINYKGKEISIAFNPRYMIDPLNALVNDEVFVELTDELSPAVLKINGPFLYVVMPMRLSWIAMFRPTRSDPISPGPWVAATSSTRSMPQPASASAPVTIGTMAARCAREASSGTTPP